MGSVFKLPVTTKSDLPSSPKYPEKEMRQHETSGSTGQPRIIWVPPEAGIVKMQSFPAVGLIWVEKMSGYLD